MSSQEQIYRARYIKIFHNDFDISVSELAKHYDMNERVVADIVRPPHVRQFAGLLGRRLPEAFTSWVAGESAASLARAYGCSRDKFYRAMQYYGPRFEPDIYERHLASTRSRGAKYGTKTP